MIRRVRWAFLCTACGIAATQVGPAPNPHPAATGDQMYFEVASVKREKSAAPPHANFPLGPGDVYVPTGGYFSATNFTLADYIGFAYKILGNQSHYLLPQLPDWATTVHFDIQARSEGNPTKDQMRLMMRSLLVDRFQLRIHHEIRQVPVLVLVLLRPAKTGPDLRPHANDAPCPTRGGSAADSGGSQTASGELAERGLPALCNAVFPMPPTVPGRTRVGARNVTIAFLADTLSWASGLDLPIVDQTGLKGAFDIALEWTPETNAVPAPSDAQPDRAAITFQTALREQLGLKLESRKGPLDILVVDRVARPQEN